jgi:hypothetical protein
LVGPERGVPQISCEDFETNAALVAAASTA